MLTVFDAAALTYVIHEIDVASDLAQLLALNLATDDDHGRQKLADQTNKALDLADKYFAKWPLGTCGSDLATAKHELGKERGHSTHVALLHRLKIDIMEQLLRHRFIRVAVGSEELVDNKELFGPGVRSRFPAANEEITDGGNALAVGINTAAVFHFMRAVEHGLRSFVTAVGVTPGVLPLDYQEWNQLIEQAKSKITVVDTWGKSAEQINARQFFNRIIGDLYSFKDDVRNVTMHTRKSYNEHEARGVKDRTEAWFKALAAKSDENMTSGALLDKGLFLS